MKQIGIITWFRDYNYGTKLQAYALQEFLNMNGYDASIINYTISSNASINEEPKRALYKRLYGKLSWELLKQITSKHSKEFEIRNFRLDEFTRRNCKLTRRVNDVNEFVNICNCFDIIITGSDQIWNPDWYNPVYYADYPGIKPPKIAYAPSIGTGSIREDKRKEIGNSLAGFKQILLREECGCDLLRSIYGISARKVVDPTLLIKKEQWNTLASKRKTSAEPFVLCYLLSDNPCHWKAVNKFVKKYDMDLRIIPKEGFSYLYARKQDYFQTIEDFITLLSNAEFVITDSFHACIFSVIFNKKFIPFERFPETSASSQNSRIVDFLTGISCMDLLMEYDSRTIEYKEIEWDRVNSIIEEQILRSKHYLIESIES